MKKIIPCLLLFIILLTGCSTKEVDVINYENAFSTSGPMAISSSAPLYASDLCVIAKDKQDEPDHVMKNSSSSLLVNRTTGELVYANNVFEKIYPASITKLATALVAFQENKLDDTITVSYNASHIKYSGAKLCGFAEGDQVPFRTMLNSLLVYSGNDAGIAIAEHLGGSEDGFSKMVNQAVAKLGATHSHFVNAHGLHDDNHYTTAYDMYLIFNELLNYEEFRSIVEKPSYKAEYVSASGREVARIFQNTNMYLTGSKKAPNSITVFGGKTGTTNEAGYCLILLSKDADGNEYISMVFDAKSRNDLYNEMNHLFSMIQ